MPTNDIFGPVKYSQCFHLSVAEFEEDSRSSRACADFSKPNEIDMIDKFLLQTADVPSVELMQKYFQC